MTGQDGHERTATVEPEVARPAHEPPVPPADVMPQSSSFDASYEVVLPARARTRYRPEVVADVIPTFGPAVRPGASWLRRVS